MRNKLAQIEIAPDTESGGFEGFGPLGTPEGSGIGQFSDVVSSAIGLLTIVAIIWFVFILLSGAIAMMSAGGDKQAMESARKRISSGLIGIVIVIAGVFVIDLIGSLLGISFLEIGLLFDLIVPGS